MIALSREGARRLEIVFDPIYSILDVKSAEQVFHKHYPDVSGSVLGILMLPLYERERHPSACITTDILSNDFTQSALSKAVRYWQSKGLLKKIGPSPARLKYVAPEKAVRDEIALSKTASLISQGLHEAEVAFSDYELARIVSWRTDKQLRTPTVIAIIRECLTISPTPDLMAVESTVIYNLQNGSSFTDAREVIYTEYLTYIKALQLKEFMGYPNPTPDSAELALYKAWTESGFSHAEIHRHARQTAGGTPSFQYLNAILARIAEERDIQESCKKEFDEISGLLHLLRKNRGTDLAFYITLRKDYPYPLIRAAVERAVSLDPGSGLAEVSLLLDKWNKKKISDPSSALEYIQQEDIALDLIDALNTGYGLKISRSGRTLSLVFKWLFKWRMSKEDVLSVASQMSVVSKPLAYIDKALYNVWQDRRSEIPF